MCRDVGERRDDNGKMNLDVFKREEVKWIEVAQNGVYCKVLGEDSNKSLQKTRFGRV
jgi:hypothetical protein